MPFQTENINFQSPLNFQLTILRLPHLVFNIQEVTLPGVELGSAKMDTQFNPVYFAGDNVTYNNLEMQFIVQEGFRDWFELWQWIIDAGFPQNAQQYKNLREGQQKTLDKKANTALNSSPKPYLQNLFSDIKLHVLTSKTNPYLEITFVNSFPLSLSELRFKTTEEDVDYLTSTVRFRYDYYEIKKI